MVRALLAALGVAVIAVAERATGYHDLATTVTDVAAGATYLAVGTLGWRASPRHARWAYVAGLAWFAGNLALPLLWVHRPLMLLAGLTFPAGRVRGRASWAVVVMWSVAAVVPSLARSSWLSLVLAVLATSVGWRLAVSARPGRRGSSRTAALSVTFLSGAVAFGGLARLLGLTAPIALGGLRVPVVPGYAGLVALAGAVLLVGQLQPAREADAVIELTDGDAAQTLAALRREVATGDDGATRQTLTAAIELLEINLELHAELESRIAEVRASRRRLVEAGMVERRRLEQRLAGGAMSYLDELSDVLTELGRTADRPRQADTDGLVRQSLDEVDLTRSDLAQLSRGLHPRLLAERGLQEALTDLGRRSPIPTTVVVPAGRLPEVIETTVWYACAEAVANMVKHSAATSAAIHISVHGRQLRATVSDNGRGGARPSSGGGLAGLADRLVAVDGSLELASPAGGGTTLTFHVPVP
jgi:signal transduction histidine kinase